MDNNFSLSSISSTVGNFILVNTFTGNFLIDWEYEKRLKMNILIKNNNSLFFIFYFLVAFILLLKAFSIRIVSRRCLPFALVRRV